MLRDELLVRARLLPPRPQRYLLPRPALAARLRGALDHRLTLVQAGTGYGKSTALAALDDGSLPLFWYSVGEADADPQRFLAYLIGAFHMRLPELSGLPQALLHEISQQPTPANGQAWAQVAEALANALYDALTQPALLVIDDYHFVSHSAEVNALAERLVACMPPSLHVILSTRYPLDSPALVGWRARGEVLEVNRDALAFQPDEIESLFGETYGMRLTIEEVAALAHQTEGWPIALQLVWQGLRSAGHPPLPAVHGQPETAAALLAGGPAAPSLGMLFSYLAHEVMGRQPAEIATFLRDTAVLRELTPTACNAATGLANGAVMLNRLIELDLFVVALGDGHYRYHHLFHDYLREQWASDSEGARARHRRAAEHFHAANDLEEAIYHWLAARRFPEAAADIEVASEPALQAGRLTTVATWIDALPPETVAEHPLLQRFLGDVHRLRSRFDEALAWYQAAERTWRARGDRAGLSRALRGQALVYLDTVRPAEAESLLEEAQRLMDETVDREARARILELLAENKLNLGQPDEAEGLRAKARALREEGPGEDALSVRVKVRTGQFDEAQRILQAWAEAEHRDAERGQTHPPRAHRETVLLLSLLHALKGEAQAAFDLASEGIALGERLDSPFITAVGQIRLGHAWQLRAGPACDQAILCYQNSIALGDRLAVRRTRAEALWGLARAYGFHGDLPAAERAAAEGAEIARWAGDLWMLSLLDLTLGISYVLAGKLGPAVEILSRVLMAFRDCGDPFGRAVSRLWLCLAYLSLGQNEHFLTCADELLHLCDSHHYDFLLTRATLLGPLDPRRLVPALLEARRCRPAYVARLLAEIGLPAVRLHPGYQLRVQTLGAFRVWRGRDEMDPHAWRRGKARQVFQLLLTERNRSLQREEIIERLWANVAPEIAGRDFKIAMSALNKALEPARPSEAPSAFIAREGSLYSLRPEADLWLDVAEFERECSAGLQLLEGRHTPASAPDIDHAIARMQAALRLYTGDYLPEALYDDWATEERERLLALYLRGADTLAGALLERGALGETLAVCESILARDPVWERAYRLIMLAHARQGNRPQALRAYQQCVASLRAELDVAPSATTVALWERIAQEADLSATTP
jgi:ATP/maltotriose-dependent transcriptional regulator MalT/DNA-binding SARP family transcriptional activator